MYITEIFSLTKLPHAATFEQVIAELFLHTKIKTDYTTYNNGLRKISI